MRPTLVTPHDPQIERLHEELDHARRTIVDLMPEPIPEILDSYTQCTSRRDVYLWESKAADQIIQFAKPLPPRGPYGGIAPIALFAAAVHRLPPISRRVSVSHSASTDTSPDGATLTSVTSPSRPLHSLVTGRARNFVKPSCSREPTPMPGSPPERPPRSSTRRVLTASPSSSEVNTSGAPPAT